MNPTTMGVGLKIVLNICGVFLLIVGLLLASDGMKKLSRVGASPPPVVNLTLALIFIVIACVLFASGAS
jgi:hypothetical protein